MKMLRISLVSLLVLVITGAVQSATIRVPEDYPTIQAGIDAAENDDVVLVADGTYVENLNFLGKSITVESASGNPALCVIDGDSIGNVVTFDSSENVDCILRGFTIQNGGSGICCWNSSPTIIGNTITGNRAGGAGGGIFCSSSSPTIANNSITDNEAGEGGGIYCHNSSPIIVSNTITKNRGAIYCDGSSVSIVNNIIAGNKGGIYYADSSATITSNTIVDNSRGIFCLYRCNLNIVNTILWNDASEEIYLRNSSVSVSYSNVQGGYPGVGNISAYPRFADVDSYLLSDYSPCIGAGIMMQDVPDTDIKGNPRPNPGGSNPDIGAYENSLGVPLPPRPTPVTIHVSTTGNDETGDGSSDNPYLTIQKGIDEVLDGDTVLVADGTYVENLSFRGRAIAVQSVSGKPESCIIDGDGKGHVLTFDSGESADSILRGFTIQNGEQGIYCWNSSPTIASNIISGNKGSGISCSDSCPTIVSNVTTGNKGSGISCSGSSLIITSNIITGNSGTGIYCINKSSATIINNMVTGNSGTGIYCTNNSSATIASNTIVDNEGSHFGGGIHCSSNSTSIIVNTILWNDSSPEIYLSKCSIEVTYSVVRGGYPGVGNIDTYPNFASVNDYHLSDYSPCIGAGMMTQDMPDTDIEGNPRPNPGGSAPDIGAYESSLGEPLSRFPVIIHVSTTGNDKTGDGSPDSPYLTIQRGIMEALDGDTVLVADGTYTENLDFLGKAITVESASGNPESCIIDGDGKYSVVTFRNGEDTGSVLRGFTIQNGGEGGIYCYGSSPTITNNIITGNAANRGGGGIYCYESSPTIANNTITGNTANHGGGGIYCINSSSPTVANNIITENTTYDNGGGIYCYESSPTIANNTITGNTASGHYGGGGIYCSNSSSAIINTILWGNMPQEVYPDDGSVNVTYSVIRGGYPGVGNIDAYPRFAGVNDYHLSDYSPCIGAGMMTQDVPDTDIEGNPRPNPNGTNPDVGAYENGLGQPLPYSPVSIHVSTTGNDETGDGSPENPYLTIQRGINEAFDGDTVLVADGTYIEILSFHGKAITVESASGNPDSCIIDGGDKDHVITFNTSEDADSVLRGFTIQNCDAGIYCWNSSPTIGSNIITGIWGTGISCSSSSPIITNNIVSGNARGISCGNSSSTIDSNTITDNSGYGISCSSSSLVISNNIISGNSAGIHCSGKSSSIMVNNIITGNSDNGVSCDDSSAIIVSNTIVANSGGIYCSSNASIAVINTILWDNVPREVDLHDGSVNITYSNVRGGYPGIGNINVYPRFTDVNDYHLSDYSPCIGAGIMTQDVLDRDIEGNPRPNPGGSNPDLGAYENKLGQPLPRSPATIHVATTGSDDAGDGSPDNPYLTIQKGIDEAFDGDTVMVADGTYTESLNFQSKTITVESASADPAMCIIDGGGKENVVTFDAGEDKGSVLRGFTIQDGARGIYCVNASPTIASNIITGSSAYGIYCYDCSPIITRNMISGNPNNGISCYYSFPIITSNMVADNTLGISCSESSPNIASNIITGNSATGVSCSYNSSATLINNTIVGNNSGGISCASDSSITMINTILWGNMPQEIYPGDGIINITYSNVRGGYPGVGNIDAYPRFAGINDYHLLDYSPCIGAGIMTQDVPDTDIEGNPRPDPSGSNPDMGAYENVLGQPLPRSPATIHVSTTGSDDTGDGSPDNPYLTIQKGIDEALDGDTVLVADGTYTEKLAFPGKAITVESASANPDSCIIYGDGKGNGVTFDSGQGPDSTLRGFTIQNCEQGIYCWNSSPTLTSNIITDNLVSGVYCYSSSPIISNNIIIATRNEGGRHDSGGICSIHNSSAIVINNTIVGNKGFHAGGIYCFWNSSITVVNTIIWGNVPQEMNPGDGNVNVTYSNVRGGYPGVGNIDTYPNFAGVNDYHLSDYSPCIGAGIVTQDVPDTDIEGNPRSNPSGSDPDIGAYENRLGKPLSRPPVIIHVSITGSDDTGDGSPDNPYLTIQRSIMEALDGDTVLVADGTYVENLSFLGKAITVESVSGDPDSCIIDGGGKEHVIDFNANEGTDSVLRGFTIQNGDQGIYCWNSSPTIVNNVITGISSIGICCNNSSTIVNSNMIKGNSGTGINCERSSSPVILNNVIAENKASNSIGILCSDRSSPVICNNTVTGNNGGGVYCENSSPTIINTILWGNMLREIYPGDGSVNVTYSVVQGGYLGVGNTNAYPRFAGMDGYHLSDYSLCIGAGIMTQDVPNTDIEGNPRPNPAGSAPDIGAYESNRGAPLPPPATRNIHISTTGSDDTGDGSPDNPYSTIQKGIDEAFDGDTVLVADGTYMENLDFHGKAITVESASDNPDSCIIDGNGMGNAVITFHAGEDTDSVLRGYTIQNSNQGIYCLNSSPTIANNIITGNNGNGISCNNSSPTIASNTITGNSDNGISCNNSLPTIASNTITGNLSHGIYCGNSSAIINSNIITANSVTGIYCSDSSPTIVNNMVIGNKGTGIFCIHSSSAAIVNNTIVANKGSKYGSGIYCSASSSATIVNTVLWNDVSPEIRLYDSSVNVTYSNVRGGYPGVGNIDTYPRFAGVNDYHLSDYSLCIGAGIMTQDVPNTDIEDNPRPSPDGSSPDIGAYENSLGVPLPPRPTPVTIHVSTTGNDETGDGSSDNPYFTIQKGIDEAFDGDTVMVSDGTYMENLSFRGRAIAVESASGNPEYCIIDGNGEGNAVVTFHAGEGTDSVLRGFTIQNSNQGIYCWNSSPTIANNIISGNQGNGISCSDSSPNVVNNRISGNQGNGISCSDSSPNIVNNMITDNEGTGISCSYDSSTTVISNTIVGNNGSDTGGIYCYRSSATVINTILWNNGQQEIYPGDGIVNVTYSNVRGGYPGIGNIDDYPRFAGVDDYYLSDYSPCIGAGTMTHDVPDTDIEGNPRPSPSGSNPDMGAHENSLGQPLPRPPATIHVSITGSDDTGDGSPDNPYLTIQKGIDEAFDGDTVLVADGTYTENLSFPDKAITVQSASGSPRFCIIDGGSKDSVVTFRNNKVADSLLRGFTIQNGKAYYVGGVYCDNSSPIISNNIIMGNEAGSQGGGGIYCTENSSPIIINNTIVGNKAGRGGGICCTGNSSSTIINNVIAENNAENGGGIYCSGSSSPVIGNNTITGNRAYRLGGGLFCLTPSAAVINTIFWDNMPQEVYKEIYPDNGTVNITYSVIRGGYPGVGNIDEYPRFVDTDDYHLSNYSACLGAGIMTQDVPGTDIEGNPRPNPAGSAPDIGAYESNRGKPLPPLAKRTIHISTTGSDDTGDGSSDNPYLTIQSGINEAFDSDTVLVADGTYIENLTFHGKAITVESASGNPKSCIMDGDGKDSVVTFRSSEGADSILRGFTIQNGSGGVYCYNSSPVISSNIIKGNRYYYHIYSSFQSNGAGICCYNSSPIIDNNVIVENRSGGGISCLYSSSPTAINNTIIGNDDKGGIYCPQDSSIIVINSIFWGNMPHEINAYADDVNVTYSNVRGDYSGVGNIDVYPRFAGVDDYHLSDYNLCIGAGMMTQDVPERDIEGNPRPNPGGSAPDMGAYENRLGVPLPPRPTPIIIHISTTGSDDTGDGSPGNPYFTIQRGIMEAFDGDTVLVADGTYVENPSFHGKAITVQSVNSNPKVCIIDGDSRDSVVTFRNSEGADSILRGFTIQNSKRGIYCWNSSPTLAGNIITGNSSIGIHCDNSSTTVDSNIITGNPDTGIYCYRSSPIITSNTITGNPGTGIYCSESSSIITSNIITGNSHTGIYCYYRSSPIITNNIITGNSGTAISCLYDSSAIVISNTIVGNNDSHTGGISCYRSSATVINTILWDNMPQEIRSSTGSVNVTYSVVRGGYLGVGNIDAYPNFAGVNDYHLSVYSPCIGAGTMTKDVPGTDIEGNPRPNPNGSNPDIGAYESSLSETASITIVSPNGGEAWSGGSSREITWQTSVSNTDCVRLLYSSDSGDTYPNTIVSSTPNNGKYEWNPVPTLDSAQIRVKAILEDSSGNVLATDATDADFIIDSTAPGTSIALSGTEGGNGWYISDVVVTLSAEDSLAGVRVTKYKVGDGTWVIYSSPFTVTGSLIHYYSEDNAGNVEAEKSIEVRIDKFAPETTVTLSGTEGKNGWYTSDVAVTLSATDSLSGVKETKYRIDDGTWKIYSLPFTVTGSTVYYYSEDNAGNTEAEKSMEVRIDKVAPGTTATLSGTEGENGWYTSDVTVTLSATDDGSGVKETRYRIDDGIWKIYSLPFTVTGSIVYYYSEDNAGNTEAEKSMEVRIDKVAPETTATLSGTEGENGWYISDVTVTLSATDSLSGIKETKYKVSSGSWETYSKPFTVSASTNGTTVYYLSEDNAGNTEAVKSQQMKIDKTAPSTPVVTDDGDHLPSTNQLHASWTSSDAQSGVVEYQYAIGTTPGGADVTNWTSTGTETEVAVTGLSLTSGRLYYFAVKARNGAGLWSDAGASDGIAKRAELLTASYDLQNPMLTLTFTDPIDPGPTRFDGIGMEVNDSGQWDFVLSDRLGLRVSETVPSKEINIDIKRAHIVASSLARAFINHRKVDILLKPIAFTDTFGLNIQEVVGTDDIEIQMISDGFMLGTVGDVNGSGEVTVDDAELILMSTIHGSTVFPIYNVASSISEQLAAYGYSYDVMMGAADADGSGDISSYDSAMVFRWSAGLGNLAPALNSNLRKSKLSVKDYDERKLEVSIDVDDVSDVYSADIVMTYDPQQLLLSDASRTSSTSGWLFEHGTELTASRSITSLRISLAGASQPSSNGSLITLSFDVLSADAVRELDIVKLKLNGGMIKASIENLPRAFALLQNYPNPFNPETWIPYQLTEVADVTITIYSVNGQIVRQLELGSKMPGHYVDRQRAAYWDSRNEWGESVSSGIYFYVIQAGTHTDMRKMLMLK